MNFEELKKRRERNLSRHKLKKRAYYLKSKLNKEIDYEDELKDDGFLLKMKSIAKSQKEYIFSRESIIKNKIKEYQEKKREYYEQNKEKRLEYDKEYRERKKEELKEYRRKYYEKIKESKFKED
ncbi:MULTISPECIES: hypothetical protein [Aliarcobacter]|jgi:hypothetical protein|uniref:Uncharacterized protein n=2 Tax=Aliarcobacter skirrowii TaxID=28200 RepID=A0A2U2C1V7_9BACT|nr:hypothetical protein [Aliarcobacter skirrowii]AXX85464.1 hypothetical protein ASKIR_1694 [Aliarcobacter skirrowii CCUG 10374]KAB0621127.1 hypothetical protein F7P70_05100 [Aliarcobacter skirrowii CCUG 10374]MCT7446364.1 hypothetical protein [Aliarcobacter skirrowii]MDD2508202.1 hypothetical protein [Aliarcobacter skirrowii]MDD3025001.1 hypothetical protein [Aliarcobacter skirrowii]